MTATFFQSFRMSPAKLETVLFWVAPLILKKEAKMTETINQSERLCVTMRYLVTDDAQVAIVADYQMSSTVVGRIIYKTSLTIWDVLHAHGYHDAPNCEAEETHSSSRNSSF